MRKEKKSRANKQQIRTSVSSTCFAEILKSARNAETVVWQSFSVFRTFTFGCQAVAQSIGGRTNCFAVTTFAYFSFYTENDNVMSRKLIKTNRI